MKITQQLKMKIIELLCSLPNIENQSIREALLVQAGVDENLYDQIRFELPAKEFAPSLIKTLEAYGTLEDGRNSLEAILISAKSRVGQEKKHYCDILIHELHSKKNSDEKKTEEIKLTIGKEDGQITILVERKRFEKWWMNLIMAP